MSEVPTEVGRTPAPEAIASRKPVMRSVAHRAHVSLAATFERRSTWMVPVRYASEDERAVQGPLVFADVSARGKVHLSGTVGPLLQRLAGRPVEPLCTAPIRTGGMAACIARDWALALVPAGGEGNVIASLGADLADAAATDMTSAMSGFLVAGPRRDDFLARTTSVRLDELQVGACVGTTWSRIPAVMLPCDLAVPSVEIYVSSDYGRYAWNVVHNLGVRLGGSPVGWSALEAWGWK